MHMLLDFNFLAILNFLVLLLWPATGRYAGDPAGVRYNAFNIVMVILTIIAAVLDIVFLAIRLGS